MKQESQRQAFAGTTGKLISDAGPVVLGDRYAKLDGAQASVAFLFASYIITEGRRHK